MNAKARQLGLTHTHFVRPDGLDVPGHYSSARDVLKLARVAMKKPLVRRLVAMQSATITGDHFPLFSWNDLLGRYPGLIGVKTGHTDAAGVVRGRGSATRRCHDLLHGRAGRPEPVYSGMPTWHACWPGARTSSVAFRWSQPATPTRRRRSGSRKNRLPLVAGRCRCARSGPGRPAPGREPCRTCTLVAGASGGRCRPRAEVRVCDKRQAVFLEPDRRRRVGVAG